MMRVLSVFFLCLAVVACEPQKSFDPASTSPSASSTSAPELARPASIPNTINQEVIDLDALIPKGYKVVATEKGDLNGDGVPDALLLVEDAANASQIAGEDAQRKLMILLGDPKGNYTVAATNDKIVPCATCGGIAGDPFAFMRPTGDGFELMIGGGSRERWSYDYALKYEAVSKSWIANQIKMSVIDTQTDNLKEKLLNRDDLHGIKFDQIDPDSLDPPVIE